MEGPLLLWWGVLCAAAAANLAGWLASFWIYRRNSAPADIRASREALLWLSAVYMMGCAFRSILPMIDVPRICLHETWVSRIFVGRSVATVAELCFAVQWMLLLREASGGRGYARMAARLVVPVIVLAEIASWKAVLTSNYLLHALENSLWALAAAIALAGFGSLHGRLSVPGRRFFYAAAATGGAYLIFMVFIDVPMYLERWSTGVAQATPLAEGLKSALAACVVEHQWAAWRDDVLWLTLYFTAAVWISIALPHVARLKPVD